MRILLKLKLLWIKEMYQKLYLCFYNKKIKNLLVIFCFLEIIKEMNKKYNLVKINYKSF